MNEKIKTLATKKGIKKLATKTESKAEQDEIVKLKKHDSCLFIGQSYFVNDGANEILFNTSTALFAEKGVSWTSQGSSTDKRTSPATTDNSLSPSIKWHWNPNFCLIFKGSCLKQRGITSTPSNKIFCFIVYKLDTWSQDLRSNVSLKITEELS